MFNGASFARAGLLVGAIANFARRPWISCSVKPVAARISSCSNPKPHTMFSSQYRSSASAAGFRDWAPATGSPAAAVPADRIAASMTAAAAPLLIVAMAPSSFLQPRE